MKPESVLVPDVMEKTSTRRRSRILCVEKITTRRREGVGVVVEKMKKVDELSTKIRVIYLQQ